MSFLYSKRYARFSLFYCVFPVVAYTIFRLYGVGIYFIAALIYSWITFINKFHNRSLTQIWESKREIAGSSTIYKTKAIMGDYIDERYRAFIRQELVFFHIKNDGILIRSTKSLSFGIRFSDVKFIEVIDPEHQRYVNRQAAYIRLNVYYPTYDIYDSFLFRINNASEFVKQISDFYSGDVVVLPYSDYANERDGKSE